MHTMKVLVSALILVATATHPHHRLEAEAFGSRPAIGMLVPSPRSSGSPRSAGPPASFATTSTGGERKPAYQQQKLSGRALVEEDLLRPNQGVLSAATDAERRAASNAWKKTVSRARGGGGFSSSGSATKKGEAKKKSAPHLEFSPRVDRAGFGAVVMTEGVARMDGCLSEETARAMLDYVNEQLTESIREVQEGTALELSRFADVLGKKNRWDMLLPLEGSDEVMRAMAKIFLDKDKRVPNTIESILGSQAQLYELSTLISDPGSERQVLHPDFPHQDGLPPALTFFVALQDVYADMGPTTYLPRSSTPQHHQELKDRLYDINSREGLLASAPNQIATLRTGDASVYNPMTLHCGGANRSDKRRSIFYFSFRNPDIPGTYTEGSSLRPELRDRGLTLKPLIKILKDWKKENDKDKS